ncbi:MAG TPA: septal ring lytic transglycosylase RlpA family protein [Clostridia bacterium]|nr:septal ring lytic transglycosylase RlpA family protein [Clostridia bacterium]
MSELRRGNFFPNSCGLRVWTVPVLLLLAAMLLTGCGGKKRSKTRIPPPPDVSSGQGTSARDRAPVPRDSEGNEVAIEPGAKVIWTETGLASWYGPPYHNRRGANGEIFNTNAMTAAHKTLPLNSIVRVTNLATEHSTVVRITDRGPFIGERIVDLSLAAAKAVDVWRPGVAKVRLDVLEAPSAIERGGRWCVQVGAFAKQRDALDLKDKLMRRYKTAKVLQFAGPTGFWVRVRVFEDDKKRAQEVSQIINVDEGGVFLVRLD